MQKAVVKFGQFLLLAHAVLSSRLITSDVVPNSKITCQNAGRYVYTVQSEMQCHHRCLTRKKCQVLNYKASSGEKVENNCEVFDISAKSYSKFCSKTPSNNLHWKTLSFKREEDITRKEYDSCKEIYENEPRSKGGKYELRSGMHQCQMNDLRKCGAGGWTLAMKIHGRKTMFVANSRHWVTSTVVNTEIVTKSLGRKADAKFAAFNSVSFTKICIAMKQFGDAEDKTARWITIPKKSSSLLEVFKGNKFQPTYLGKDAWLTLVNGGSLTPYCNKEGFNVPVSGNVRIRLGILSNGVENCDTPDNYIGFGHINGITSGTNSISTMGYILIQ